MQVIEALESLAWFIKEHEKTFNNKDFTSEDFDIIFNTDMITNEAQTILDCKNSEGVISKQTIVSNHPWVIDPKEAIRLLEKEQEEEQALIFIQEELSIREKIEKEKKRRRSTA